VIDAGFVVDGVGTPAIALLALARSRGDAAAPGAAVAYVAIGAGATCIAMVRDGLLLFAREMAWGYATVAPGEPVEARMASELKRSILYFKQTFRATLESLVLCGDMPDLRSVTAPLGEALGVAVETLDSLAGIDATAIPEPADGFRRAAPALRVAIAAGAQAAAPANLLPGQMRAVRESRRLLVRVAAAIIAGVLPAGAWLYTATAAAAAARAEVAAIERQLAIIEPQRERLARSREAGMLASRQQAALTAFDAQGPRLARLLEAVAHAAPEEVALTTIRVEADAGVWQVVVNGIALAEDAAAGQAAVTRFLAALAASPYAGTPLGAPSFRIVAGTRDVATPGADRPANASDVEFSARFALPR
jgi:hypothetical protein